MKRIAALTLILVAGSTGPAMAAQQHHPHKHKTSWVMKFGSPFRTR